MSNEIFVRVGPGETRYAMTVEGILTRQFIHRAGATASLSEPFTEVGS